MKKYHILCEIKIFIFILGNFAQNFDQYYSLNLFDTNIIGNLSFSKLIVFPIHPWTGTKSLAKSAITDRPLHGQ